MKIIIKSSDFNKEVLCFLNGIGADIPVDWTMEALERVRDAAIDAFEEMGILLEIDERWDPPSFSLP